MAYAHVMEDLRPSDDHAILLTHTISLAAGTARYILPPNIAEVWRLGKISSDTGLPTHDFVPRSEYNGNGPGWRLEANELVFVPTPTLSEDWLLWYVPSGEAAMHVGTGTVVSPTVITLDAAPDLGQLDMRDNAYAGYVLRVIEDGRVHQERVIQSYDAATRRATTRLSFTQSATHLPADGQSVYYEVVPFMDTILVHAVAVQMTLALAPSKGFTIKKHTQLDSMYINDRKRLRDRYANIIVRRASVLERNTIDHNRRDDLTGLPIIGSRTLSALGYTPTTTIPTTP